MHEKEGTIQLSAAAKCPFLDILLQQMPNRTFLLRRWYFDTSGSGTDVYRQKIQSAGRPADPRRCGQRLVLNIAASIWT